MTTNNIEPMSTLEIDLEEFDKNTLINLIQVAHLNDLTFNETLVMLLTEALSEFKINEDKNQLPLL
jgi:hypothetical protein